MLRKDDVEISRFRLEITPLARELRTPAIPGGLLTTSAGNFQTLFKGSGLEFKDFREYAPMDDARRIDWKASLKSNKILIKEYIEERNAEIIFCFDVSDGMIFGSGNKLKNQYGAEFIISLGQHIIDAGDAVGLLTFNDKITNFIPPTMGDQQIHLLMDILSAFSTYGGRSNFDNVLKFLENNVLEGSTIFFISDFFRFHEFKRYKRIMKVLSNKFEMIFVILRDPVEEFLAPKQKQVLLYDPDRNLNILITPSKIKKRYVKETRREKEKLKNYLREVNIPTMEIYTDKPFVQPLYEFFTRRGYG